MRFGVSLFDGSPKAVREVVAVCRGAGIDTVLCADHLGMAAPFSTLAYAAAIDPDIALATFVLNQDFWNPVLVAREAATLATLCEGRFTLGVGAGHMRHENERAGLTFDANPRRAAKLRPWLDAVRTELSVLGHRGLPILIGGNGRPVLTLGGEIATSVGLVGFTHVDGGKSIDGRWFTWSGIGSRIAIVGEAAAGMRRTVPALNVLVQAVVITDDRHASAEKWADRIPPELLLDSPFFLLGTEAEIVAQIHRAETELGISSFVAFSTMLDPWAQIVQAASG